MSDFYRRALRSALTESQYRELLVSASGELARLKAVLDSLPQGILVCDEKHLPVLTNKSALRLLPLSQGEGRPPWELVPDPELAAFLRETLQSGDRALEREFDVRARSGKRLLAVSVHPLVDRKRISGSLVYLDDITERRSRETLLYRAETLAGLTTLAAGVAHEIKNPLGAISINLQLLRKTLGPLPPETGPALEKYFGVLNEEIERLNGIVVDFLLAVRPMAPELRRENLGRIVGELAELVGPELERCGIRLISETDPGLPDALLDRRQIKQMLLNLAENAKAAMPEGGTLTVAAAYADGDIVLTVSDSGTGIPPENLGKIFQPYFSTRETGTGLGLTIAYKIIREHRGEISVDSGEGRGTGFRIVLPALRKERKLLVQRDRPDPPEGGPASETRST